MSPSTPAARAFADTLRQPLTIDDALFATRMEADFMARARIAAARRVADFGDLAPEPQEIAPVAS